METKQFDIEKLSYGELKVLTNLSHLTLTPAEIYDWELFRGYIRYREERDGRTPEVNIVGDTPEYYPATREEFSKIEDKTQLRHLLNPKLKVPVPNFLTIQKDCRRLQKAGWLVKDGEKYLIYPERVSLFEKQFEGLTKEKVEQMRAKMSQKRTESEKAPETPRD